MAEYRIICTTQEPSNVPNDRAHVVAVGTGSSASTYDKYWILSEVLKAMDNGDSFYTFGEGLDRGPTLRNINAPMLGNTHPFNSRCRERQQSR